MKAQHVRTVNIETLNKMLERRGLEARRAAMNDVFWRIVIWGTIGTALAVFVAENYR